MLKQHFSRALAADPDRLHFSAHSHHLWPDVTRDAQQRVWEDAAALADRKWDVVLGEQYPKAQAHLARHLGLSDPSTLAFAANTQDLIFRLLTCLPIFGGEPIRVLTTDAEFHSFHRQLRRLEEAGLAEAEWVAAEPFDSFPDRFAAAAAVGGHDLVYFSQVFFNSGYAVPNLEALVNAVPDSETYVVIDGYHGFLARPTDLSAVESRAFYTGGGYKYAMSGEGVCYLHCPPGYGERPIDTGWFAVFGKLEEGVREGMLPYSVDGYRFVGATLEHSGLYRFNAVMDWLAELGVTATEIHSHVRSLHARFLERLATLELSFLGPTDLIPSADVDHRGNFLTFRRPEAGALQQALGERGVIVDYRDDRLRFGFGVYHEADDVDRLCTTLSTLSS